MRMLHKSTTFELWDLFDEEISDIVNAVVWSLTLSTDEATQQSTVNADQLVQTWKHLLHRLTAQTNIRQQTSNEHLTGIGHTVIV